MTTCQVFNKLPFIKFILQHFNKICSMVSKTVRSLYRYPYAGLVLSCEGKLSCSATQQLKHHQRIYHIPSKPNQYRTLYLTNIWYVTSLCNRDHCTFDQSCFKNCTSYCSSFTSVSSVVHAVATQSFLSKKRTKHFVTLYHRQGQIKMLLYVKGFNWSKSSVCFNMKEGLGGRGQFLILFTAKGWLSFIYIFMVYLNFFLKLLKLVYTKFWYC